MTISQLLRQEFSYNIDKEIPCDRVDVSRHVILNQNGTVLSFFGSHSLNLLSFCSGENESSFKLVSGQASFQLGPNSVLEPSHQLGPNLVFPRQKQTMSISGIVRDSVTRVQFRRVLGHAKSQKCGSMVTHCPGAKALSAVIMDLCY